MPPVLRNLWRRLVLLAGGAIIRYPGPAKAEVVPFPTQKPAAKRATKPDRSGKRVINGGRLAG